MNKNYYAVLMAGGVGSRFWPVSTSEYPKQFQDMLGTGDTLLQRTFKRLNSFIPTENILVLTNERYRDLVTEQLPEINSEQVLGEPCRRNTAPCILYAAMKIKKMNEEAIMLVAPSDHWIENENAFSEDVIKSFELCSTEKALCTLGITPHFPNTGYGYIEWERDEDSGVNNGFRKVVQFREKPNYKTAKSFLEAGNFLWNAGIFIWSASTIIDAFKNHQPSQFELFNEGYDVLNTSGETDFIEQNYHRAEDISIDYAILEKAETIYVLPASFDWSDLGTWGSLYDKLDKDRKMNALVNAELWAVDSGGNMVRTPKEKLVVIDGLSDYIVVDKEDVLMIMPKSKEQEIKSVLAQIKEKYGDQFG